MSGREKFQGLLHNSNSYAFHKVEGLPTLSWNKIVTQEDLTVGDKVNLFRLPDGKYFISKARPKDERAFTVGKITPAHLYFDDDILLEEK